MSFILHITQGRGRRWALTAAFMVHDETPARPDEALDFATHCVHPVAKSSYDHCRLHWAATLQGAG